MRETMMMTRMATEMRHSYMRTSTPFLSPIFFMEWCARLSNDG